MPALATFVALVIAVHDGDSLRVRTDAGQVIAVRVAGIDAPELQQAWGRASGNSLRRLCLHKAAIVRPQTRDRYKRLVAHVRCGRTDASHHQVERGMAWVFTRYEPAGSQLYHWQARAQLHQRGLWHSELQPIPPWQWRHTRKININSTSTLVDGH